MITKDLMLALLTLCALCLNEGCDSRYNPVNGAQGNGLQAGDLASSNLLRNPCAEEGNSDWTFCGGSGVSAGLTGNHVFYTQDLPEARACIYQDIELPRDAPGKYLFLSCRSWVAYVRENSTTRHPYVYGYQFAGDTLRIAQQMQSQDMLHDTESGEWQKLFGVFAINSRATGIRLFLSQASMVGDDPDGTCAAFDDLVVMVFDTKEEAQAYARETDVY